MTTTKHAVASSLIKAVRIGNYGGSEQLKYEEAPLPRLDPNHVLAKVRYAGVNPVDWKIREGYMKKVFPASFPLTLGHDFAGEIVNAGGDSRRFSTGERVFGFGDGAYAEFTEAAISDIATIPEKIDFAVAAALPKTGPAEALLKLVGKKAAAQAFNRASALGLTTVLGQRLKALPS